jgi:hypothetical protein
MGLMERQMATQSKTVFAFAALVVASFATAAQAATVFPTDQASYARWRVDAAFDVVAKMPAVAPVRVPMAMKGDLQVPAGCTGASGDTQAECMDVAYEPDSMPSVVIETRVGATSTLMRMDQLTVAGVNDTPALQAE